VTRERVTVVESQRLAETGAELIAGLLRDAIARRHGASVALAGGRTPEPVYRWLAGLPLPWEQVDLFFGDERAVSPDDARSNYRMVREALLERLPAAVRAVHRMAAERDDRERAAAEYAALLPERLDLLVLGIGEDGHTVSLFPGSPALAERARRVVPVPAPAASPRLTITPPVIAAARGTLVIAAGDRKATAVRRALRGEVSANECPARLVREGRWLLDRAAAGELGGDR
jgi:6-phosphogluconolactonase